MSKNLHMYNEVKELIQKHEQMFASSLPLVASENLTSIDVRRAVASDMIHRYAEGPPGARIYAGCRYMDEVEKIAVELAKKLFHAEFADVRPTSGLLANLSVYVSLTSPGDTILSLPVLYGGHVSSAGEEESGSAWMVHGLDVDSFVFDTEIMNIEVDSSLKKLKKMVKQGRRPKIVTFGASLFLFPHPVKEMESAIHEHGSIILYDGAHVAGLIAGRRFQDPMTEGADLMTFSTHKTLFGPQGGAIVGKESYREAIERGIFPGLTSNHHPNLVAGKAIAFAELAEFGEKYARAVVDNAKALASRLAELGEKVLAENLGFTQSHQLAIDVSKYGGGIAAERLLESYNIFCNRQSIPGMKSKQPMAIRVGTAELTRLGMDKNDMVEVAEIVQSALQRREKNEVIRRIERLREMHREVEYTFTKSPAYANLFEA
ncbi:MAG: serine hydroxymethyltransferase [Conexivisphaerales archaeon]